MPTSDWSPDSWKKKAAGQQASYADLEALEQVVRELSSLPPLVTSWEVEGLKSQLAEVASGRRFLLQGGDCNEIFSECESAVIANKLKILLQMSLVLVHSGKKRVIRVGRFAGQYAKPRSEDLERQGDQVLPSYRGDLINGIDFDPRSRSHDPRRLLRGYARSALTLNFIRSLIDGGFADLHHPEYWDLGFVEHSPLASEYQAMVEGIGDSLRFMETLAGSQVGDLGRVDFFTSHEGLHLLYEQAQTRQVPHRPGWYNLASHFPWIGMRTAELEGAHLEYFRGISNPIGLKVGPGVDPKNLVEICKRLNPNNEAGRLTLIHRLGAHCISTALPPIIEAVRDSGCEVVWCCDPMHGNTVPTASGRKTRQFDHIVSEVEYAFDIHAEFGTYLGGLHIELTGENVTECVGGARGLDESELERDYKSFVDPRLNYEQALELAMGVGRRMSTRQIPIERSR